MDWKCFVDTKQGAWGRRRVKLSQAENAENSTQGACWRGATLYQENLPLHYLHRSSGVCLLFFLDSSPLGPSFLLHWASSRLPSILLPFGNVCYPENTSLGEIRQLSASTGLSFINKSFLRQDFWLVCALWVCQGCQLVDTFFYSLVVASSGSSTANPLAQPAFTMVNFTLRQGWCIFFLQLVSILNIYTAC